MNGRAPHTVEPRSAPVPAAQDEWGMFDPDQAGLKAAIRAVHALNTRADDDEEPDSEAIESAPEPVVRNLSLAPSVHAAPQQPSAHSAPVAAPHEPVREKEETEEVYELKTSTPDAPRTANRGAVYTLEF